MFEVISEVYDAETDRTTQIVEARRTDRKAAAEDVEILKFLGKKSWIVDLSRAGEVS